MILLRFPESLAAILQLKNLILDHCRNHPISLFVALVILPGLGFPVSALPNLIRALREIRGLKLFLLIPNPLSYPCSPSNLWLKT